jgi:hypothetical protein
MSSSNCAICCLPLNENDEDNSNSLKNKLILSCEGHPQSRGNLHVKHCYHLHCTVESVKNGYFYCPIVPRERVCYDFNSIQLISNNNNNNNNNKVGKTNTKKHKSINQTNLYDEKIRIAQLLFYFFLIFFFFLTTKDQKQSLYSINIFSDFISLTSFLFLIGINWSYIKRLSSSFHFFI